MVKINVSIDEDVLKELDAVAHEANISRSALLAQAVKNYLAEKEMTKKRKKRRQAVQSIRKLAGEIGDWDGTAEILKRRLTLYLE
jgi:metal-responsive CopG/Arc/MetJ family transcriptional regulator